MTGSEVARPRGRANRRLRSEFVGGFAALQRENEASASEAGADDTESDASGQRRDRQRRGKAKTQQKQRQKQVKDEEGEVEEDGEEEQKGKGKFERPPVEYEFEGVNVRMTKVRVQHLKDMWNIDSWELRSELAYANDPMGFAEAMGAPAGYVQLENAIPAYILVDNVPYLFYRAAAPMEPGDEVLIRYGTEYWSRNRLLSTLATKYAEKDSEIKDVQQTLESKRREQDKTRLLKDEIAAMVARWDSESQKTESIARQIQQKPQKSPEDAKLLDHYRAELKMASEKIDDYRKQEERLDYRLKQRNEEMELLRRRQRELDEEKRRVRKKVEHAHDALSRKNQEVEELKLKDRKRQVRDTLGGTAKSWATIHCPYSLVAAELGLGASHIVGDRPDQHYTTKCKFVAMAEVRCRVSTCPKCMARIIRGPRAEEAHKSQCDEYNAERIRQSGGVTLSMMDHMQQRFDGEADFAHGISAVNLMMKSHPQGHIPAPPHALKEGESIKTNSLKGLNSLAEASSALDAVLGAGLAAVSPEELLKDPSKVLRYSQVLLKEQNANLMVLEALVDAAENDEQLVGYLRALVTACIGGVALAREVPTESLIHRVFANATGCSEAEIPTRLSSLYFLTSVIKDLDVQQTYLTPILPKADRWIISFAEFFHEYIGLATIKHHETQTMIRSLAESSRTSSMEDENLPSLKKTGTDQSPSSDKCPSPTKISSNAPGSVPSKEVLSGTPTTAKSQSRASQSSQQYVESKAGTRVLSVRLPSSAVRPLAEILERESLDRFARTLAVAKHLARQGMFKKVVDFRSGKEVLAMQVHRSVTMDTFTSNIRQFYKKFPHPNQALPKLRNPFRPNNEEMMHIAALLIQNYNITVYQTERLGPDRMSPERILKIERRDGGPTFRSTEEKERKAESGDERPNAGSISDVNAAAPGQRVKEETASHMTVSSITATNSPQRNDLSALTTSDACIKDSGPPPREETLTTASQNSEFVPCDPLVNPSTAYAVELKESMDAAIPPSSFSEPPRQLPPHLHSQPHSQPHPQPLPQPELQPKAQPQFQPQHNGNKRSQAAVWREEDSRGGYERSDESRAQRMRYDDTWRRDGDQGRGGDDGESRFRKNARGTSPQKHITGRELRALLPETHSAPLLMISVRQEGCPGEQPWKCRRIVWSDRDLNSRSERRLCVCAHLCDTDFYDVKMEMVGNESGEILQANGSANEISSSVARVKEEVSNDTEDEEWRGKPAAVESKSGRKLPANFIENLKIEATLVETPGNKWWGSRNAHWQQDRSEGASACIGETDEAFEGGFRAILPVNRVALNPPLPLSGNWVMELCFEVPGGRVLSQAKPVVHKSQLGTVKSKKYLMVEHCLLALDSRAGRNHSFLSLCTSWLVKTVKHFEFEHAAFYLYDPNRLKGANGQTQAQSQTQTQPQCDANFPLTPFNQALQFRRDALAQQGTTPVMLRLAIIKETDRLLVVDLRSQQVVHCQFMLPGSFEARPIALEAIGSRYFGLIRAAPGSGAKVPELSHGMPFFSPSNNFFVLPSSAKNVTFYTLRFYRH